MFTTVNLPVQSVQTIIDIDDPRLEIPIDEAVGYLKDAVVTSYGKKGQHIVDMNNGAIDKGIEALHKVEVPASWKDAVDEAVKEDIEFGCG